MPKNFANSITAREYYASNGQWGAPHNRFQHTPVSGKPAPPSTSGLSAVEIATITNWMKSVDNGDALGTDDVAPTQCLDGTALSPAGKIAIQNYVSYFATSVYENWQMDNIMTRLSQWRWRMADVHDANAPALAKTSHGAGTGSNPPAAEIPPSQN